MARLQPARVRRVYAKLQVRVRSFRDDYWEAYCNSSHGRGKKRAWSERHPTHNGAHMAKAAHNRESHNG